MAETGRRWTERVEHRRARVRSGFGQSAGTLSYWKWRLSRELQHLSAMSAARKRRARKPKFVELAPVALSDDRMEVELSEWSPTARAGALRYSDTQALTRLIAIVGAA